VKQSARFRVTPVVVSKKKSSNLYLDDQARPGAGKGLPERTIRDLLKEGINIGEKRPGQFYPRDRGKLAEGLPFIAGDTSVVTV